MESASVIVIFIACLTVTLMLYSKRSNTMIFAIGEIAAIVAAYIATGGDTSVVIQDLAWNRDYSEPYRLFTDIWVLYNPFMVIVNMAFIAAIGFVIEKRVPNWAYVLIMFGSSILGQSQWGMFSDQTTFGLVPVSMGLAGAALALFFELHVVLPRPIGDTRLKIWHVCLIWFVAMSALLMVTADISTWWSSYALTIICAAYGVGLGFTVDSERVKDFTAYAKIEKHINIEALRPLCITESQMDMYVQMTELEDPYLKDLWAEAFVKGLVCPKCGKNIWVVDNMIVCQNGHLIK